MPMLQNISKTNRGRIRKPVQDDPCRSRHVGNGSNDRDFQPLQRGTAARFEDNSFT